MGILSWIVVGLIAGALAKWIIPGDVPGGILATILIGIGGGLVGGGIVSFLGGAGATGLNIWTIVVATLGAVLLLFVYRAVAGRSSV
ncbi:MAG: GlsB/YeaQ/YmgE family stress response membrane protein [Rubrobacter sp.]|nr:GlsB/YeaQ/YmgE family stress response membrane protein [Rubrobacter sp.]